MVRSWVVWLFVVVLLAAPRGARVLLPETQDAPQSCINQRDDDGDFLADCEERDCWAHPSCQPPSCDTDEQCQHPECEFSPSCFEADCFDALDNDKDGAADCYDPDCDNFVDCVIELCSDHEDNDQNGATDCEDPQCQGADGCLFTSCEGVCLGPERCDDQRDNDQDSLFDCRDPDCFATPSCGGERDLGAGCSQSIQCASGVCLSEVSAGYPDGLCTKECRASSDCPDGSLCAGGLCFSPCQESDECRDGYSCFSVGASAACLPDCGEAEECPDSGACNVYSGYCTAELGKKRDLALCQQDEECESDHCIDGFCASLCDEERGACPPYFSCRIERDAKTGTCIPKSFGVDFVAPWDQPRLLPQLYQEQQLSSSLVAPSPIEDAAAHLFSLDKVHTIHISVSREGRQRLALGEKEWVRASFSFDGEHLNEIGLRLKGGDGSGEELPNKAAFSLKFDAFTRDLSFYGLKKLLLNNANQDPSYISEPLTYWLYQRYGILAPRAAFAEVYLDGELYGLYVMVEAKDKIFMKSRLGVSAPLYEGTYGADFDQVDSLEEHIEGGLPALETLQNFLLMTPDRELLPQLGSFFDVDQFFLVWAIDSFFDHWDGYFFEVNNFYVYQDQDSRHRFLPHGADQLFGTRDTRIDATPSGALAKYLARSSLVKDRFLREVERLMSDPSLEDDLRAKADSLFVLIDEAARRDTKRRSNEAEREIFSLWIREYIRARRDFIEVSGALLYGAPYSP